MKSIIKNLFSKTYNILITMILILLIAGIEFIFTKNSLDIDIFGELFQTMRRIFLIILASSIWTIAIFHLLFTFKKTAGFENRNFNKIFQNTLKVILIIHLPFALGIELFSLFVTIFSLKELTEFFNNFQHVMQPLRGDKNHKTPKYKHKIRNKRYQKIKH